MQKILVIGASGFVGGRLARALLAKGHAVRCLARTPSKVQGLAALGCEIVQGDISDLASLQRATDGIEAIYVSIHTLSPQHADTAGQGFMEVEMNGLRNIVAAAKAHGVRRLIYVTSLGIGPGSTNVWTRERWKAQQFLFGSGLDVTVLQPGQIVGQGGHGFHMMMRQAGGRFAVMMGAGRRKWRNIAVSDLVYYLVGVLDDPRSFGHAYEVGCDDVLTSDQMVDTAADVLGKPHPAKIHLPADLLIVLAPIIERLAKLPKGALKGLLDDADGDMVGNPMPIRALLPRPPLSYRQAIERALDSPDR